MNIEVVSSVFDFELMCDFDSTDLNLTFCLAIDQMIVKAEAELVESLLKLKELVEEKCVRYFRVDVDEKNVEDFFFDHVVLVILNKENKREQVKDKDKMNKQQRSNHRLDPIDSV